MLILSAAAALLLFGLYARRRAYREVSKLRGVFVYVPKDGLVEREGGLASRYAVRPSEIAGLSIISLLLHEDDLFFEHHGFNLREIRNRIAAALHGERLSGGSSISQQTVKLIHLFGMPRIVRKLLEVAYVRALESLYTKEEILTLYLSNLRLGTGVHGVREAAWRTFSKDTEQLNLGETSIIWGTIPDPSIEQELLISRANFLFDYGRTNQKLKDLLRFLSTKKYSESFRALTFAEARAWMLEYGKFDNRAPLEDSREADLTLEALVHLHEVFRARNTIRRRSWPEIGKCRDFVYPEYRELLEAGVSELSTAPPRRIPRHPRCDMKLVHTFAQRHGMAEQVSRFLEGIPGSGPAELETARADPASIVRTGWTDGWRRLGEILRLSHVLESREMDWGGVIDAMRDSREIRKLLVSASLARTLFEIRVPESISAAIEGESEIGVEVDRYVGGLFRL